MLEGDPRQGREGMHSAARTRVVIRVAAVDPGAQEEHRMEDRQWEAHT